MINKFWFGLLCVICSFILVSCCEDHCDQEFETCNVESIRTIRLIWKNRWYYSCQIVTIKIDNVTHEYILMDRGLTHYPECKFCAKMTKGHNSDPGWTTIGTLDKKSGKIVPAQKDSCIIGTQHKVTGRIPCPPATGLERVSNNHVSAIRK